MSAICKDNKEQVPKIADILAQLLQADDYSELVTVQESLVALLKFDAKGTKFILPYSPNELNRIFFLTSFITNFQVHWMVYILNC